jgi:DNA-binding MarR family transcriptional regulator
MKKQKDSKKVKRQKDIEKVAKLTSDQLLKSWLVIDDMLPEELHPIRDGLKHRRIRSGKGTRLATNFMMFTCTAGILHRDGAMTMGQLSKATSIPQSTATRMADWMVNNKYVERFYDAGDRRVVRIRLTDSGLELLLAAREQLKELAATIVKRVPAIQRTALFFMLKDLASAWQSVYDEQIESEQDSK